MFPADGESTESLCANAETALSKAKQANQRYLFYAPEMNARVAESLAMENRLRRALEEGRLALHYQPKIDVKTGAVAGLEALIRWTDPGARRACRRPSSSALLEETGMILAAGRWALAPGGERHPPLAVARHGRAAHRGQRLGDPAAPARLRRLGAARRSCRAAARSRCIDLEITESVLVDDIEESTRKLQTLRRAGVEVSVDDFGTGYCSLSYLARLPVDTLKIDRSFVVRMRDAGYPRNIVAMIVSLAHTLGLKVIAEGVEEDEQVSLLKRARLRPDPGLLRQRRAARAADRRTAAPGRGLRPCAGASPRLEGAHPSPNGATFFRLPLRRNPGCAIPPSSAGAHDHSAMQRKERDPSRRADGAPKGCAGCLLCRGVLPVHRSRLPAPAVRLRPGAAARLFVV